MSDSPGFHGFVAGIFSGITKLTVGHPFDTVKVRMQTNSAFTGPMNCVIQTARREGLKGFYKGATPPLVGWMFMDSVMLGSLHNYRRYLHRYVYTKAEELPLSGKCAAGLLAGWTVSFIAAPIEHVKALLQVQYGKSTRLYNGPVDCAKKLIRDRGIWHGLYHGLFATLIFRTNFIFWWGSYDVLTKWFQQNSLMSPLAINFWVGGLSASIFWLFAYPSDVIKQRIMTDSLTNPKFNSWLQAAKYVYRENGVKGFFRGFVPSILRSFPANASALAAFEASMRIMNGAQGEGTMEA